MNRNTVRPSSREGSMLPKAYPSVASPIICRSALAIEAHRGGASLANTLGMGCALRPALRSDGCVQPTTSDRGRDTSGGGPSRWPEGRVASGEMVRVRVSMVSPGVNACGVEFEAARDVAQKGPWPPCGVEMISWDGDRALRVAQPVRPFRHLAAISFFVVASVDEQGRGAQALRVWWAGSVVGFGGAQVGAQHG